jgi:hypothetical protein
MAPAESGRRVNAAERRGLRQAARDHRNALKARPQLLSSRGSRQRRRSFFKRRIGVEVRREAKAADFLIATPDLGAGCHAHREAEQLAEHPPDSAHHGPSDAPLGPSGS